MVQVENLPYHFFLSAIIFIFFLVQQRSYTRSSGFQISGKKLKRKIASLKRTILNSTLTTCLSTVENQVIVFKFNIKTWNWFVESTEHCRQCELVLPESNMITDIGE